MLAFIDAHRDMYIARGRQVQSKETEWSQTILIRGAGGPLQSGTLTPVANQYGIRRLTYT
jgi:hypothetical protein